MPESKQSTGKLFPFLLDNIVPVSLILIVLFMFIPLGKVAIDIAMVLNLTVAFVVMLTVIYLKRAADFSAFPRVVLILTLFGLAINVSSTRNILINPVTGNLSIDNLQSSMVKTFAQIVAGENLVVGFIIFIILIVVQVLVVTKGADRVSEVSARFTLDSMNNKMFDIQNDLNAGLISEDEAKRRKEALRQENAFYSAMDGSSKFVSGNVKAGIFITVVNLIGGVITGMIGGGLSMQEAFKAYALLTIGDGLVSQLPALLLSFSTALLVTGTSEKEILSDQLKKQFSVDGTLYLIVAATLAVLAVAFHNSASFVLFPSSALLVFLGLRLVNSKKKELALAAEMKGKAKTDTQKASTDELKYTTKPDDLSLEIGYALIPLVEKEKGAELLERIKRVRREVALNLGLVVPPIHIVDQIELPSDEYSFKIRNIEVGRSKLKLGHYMCINTGNVPEEKQIVGEKTKEPTFGMDAIWLTEDRRQEAESAGYAVIDPPTIIATHLQDLISKHAFEILSRQEVKNIIDQIKESNPVVVDEVLSGEYKFTYGEIEAVLKNLLSEMVSISDMVTILETLADFGRITKNPYVLSEKVRQALGAQICMQYVDESKTLHVLNLSQALAEKILAHSANFSDMRPYVAFDPVDGRNYISAVSSAIAQVRNRNYLPIILCADDVRYLVKSSIEREMPGTVVLSLSEVLAAGNNIKVESLGEISE